MSARRTKGKSGRKSFGKSSGAKRLALCAGVSAFCAYAAFSAFAVWFVHHGSTWLELKRTAMPDFVYNTLLSVGGGWGDVTDGLGWTGHDAVYEYDEDPPSGQILFAGAPRRTGYPAPKDIQVLERGEFLVGYSPSLRHPVWCAYHVPRLARFESGKRPGFTKDRSVANAVAPSEYERTGYDRGHMVPNHAIETRFGVDAQKATFMMSNICPQSPALNQGPWRDIEHRISDFWTSRWGEIWVIVGCYSDVNGNEKLSGTNIDVPTKFYQIVVAQDGLDVRAFAVLMEQAIGRHEYAARHLISIDELEELTGFDFLPDLPEFIQSPLEAELPSRLWPVRLADIIPQIALRFKH